MNIIHLLPQIFCIWLNVDIYLAMVKHRAVKRALILIPTIMALLGIIYRIGSRNIDTIVEYGFYVLLTLSLIAIMYSIRKPKAIKLYLGLSCVTWAVDLISVFTRYYYIWGKKYCLSAVLRWNLMDITLDVLLILIAIFLLIKTRRPKTE